jgi:predicted short-subunit dehydrogenase-like oxidoreductase (DUF2520 family)
MLPGGVLVLPESQLANLPASQLILIATPDDVVSAVAGKLAKTQKGMRGGRTVLHTSGALSSEVLRPLGDIGLHLGSMHPLISVSDPGSGATKLPGAFFCLEGDQVAKRVAHSVVRDLDGHGFSIEAADKALYHAAAVMASGHMTALFDIALEMLARCGLSERRARQVLSPLVASAVANLASQEPAQALTGTFARGDVATVARHLAALSAADLADALSAYRLLGKRSLKLATKNGVDPAVLKKITNLLDRVPKGRRR